MYYQTESVRILRKAEDDFKCIPRDALTPIEQTATYTECNETQTLYPCSNGNLSVTYASISAIWSILSSKELYNVRAIENVFKKITKGVSLMGNKPLTLTVLVP